MSTVCSQPNARRFCYWSLFSGAFGHTYGCNEVWQMWAPGRGSTSTRSSAENRRPEP
ncbi:MAG TPA: DUF4038 domain-containing protein [Candidatus Paceibacterota bacterium]|nr:DUF4038 domain-containing protein [Verrucomicrobiota bacterium]HRY46682.1 DUF4038 domain-containing protein [Candidatus Paceibacterota bacterium]